MIITLCLWLESFVLSLFIYPSEYNDPNQPQPILCYYQDTNVPPREKTNRCTRYADVLSDIKMMKKVHWELKISQGEQSVAIGSTHKTYAHIFLPFLEHVSIMSSCL